MKRCEGRYGDPIPGDWNHDRCGECGKAVTVTTSLGQRFLDEHYREATR